MSPSDPIAAVTHDDPYPYYRELLARPPLWHDASLGLWVAASAAAVEAALRHPALRVRPPAEPVPKALQDTAAGQIFGRLVRMNDGAGHCPFKQALASTLAAIGPEAARAAGLASAQALLGKHRPAADLAGLDAFVREMPARAVAHLLGVPADHLDEVAAWTDDFVGCLSPLADTAAVVRGTRAAEHLQRLFHALLRTRTSAYLVALADAAQAMGRLPTDIVVANGIGLLSQTYEATAALIGNTLLALGRQPSLSQSPQHDWHALREVVAEVVRYDAPVQNTRRFAAEEATLEGMTLPAGTTLLVVLAAANRDPAANASPEAFLPRRAARRAWTFGAGVHACPGEMLAVTIAASAVEQLLHAGLDPAALSRTFAYRRSGNIRLPQFHA